jgi:SPP1 family predicted phage head-tail adaptor
MALRAGTLNKRVILQTVTETRTASGGATDSWANTATLWAAIRPLQGRERFAAQQVSGTLTTEVEIRYRAGVVAQQRFMYGPRLFYIVQPPIDPDELGERLVCLCEERNV